MTRFRRDLTVFAGRFLWARRRGASIWRSTSIAWKWWRLELMFTSEELYALGGDDYPG